ncbi:hypothetical protein KJ865_14535 [Myxococcota bacterium]|nr:hypothetical protein [Myxococcota bacterium]
MRALIPFLLLSLLVPSCAKKAAAGPKDVAMIFLAAVINDWSEHKIKYVDKKTRARLEQMSQEAKHRGLSVKPVDLLISVPQARDDWLGKKSQKIITQTATTAVVEIVSDTPNAPKITLDLVREKGEWKISLLE